MSFNFVEKVMCIGGNGTEVPTLQFYRKGFVLGGTSTPTWQDIILHGNTALTLVNAKADSLEYLKLFGDTEQNGTPTPDAPIDIVCNNGAIKVRHQSGLPLGFQRVEYLESTDAGQYIDLGYTLNTVTDDIEIEIQLVQTEGQINFFGARGNTSANVYTLATGPSQWRWGWKQSSAYVSSPAIDTNKHTLRIDHTTNQLLLDGIVIDTRTGGTDITTSTTAILFGIHATSVQIFYLSPVRISGFRKWTDGVLVTSLVSCRRNSDNVLGMYDLVSDTFLTNAGEGTFVAGADVDDIEIYTDGTTETVEITGKNLFDVATKIEGYYINESGNLVESANFSYSSLIPVVEGSTYTWSGTSTRTTLTGKRCHGFNSNGEWVQQIDYITTNSGNYSLSFTIPSGIAYIRISGMRINEYPDTNIQVEQGTTATTYEPYFSGGQATAENLFKVGTYQDVQSVLNGSVTRNVGIYVLDGTETWSKSSTYTGSFYSSSIKPPDGTKVANNPNAYCTHGFKVDNLPEYASAPIGAFYWYSPPTINYKYDDGTATVAQFKQWLADQYNAGQPVVIVYPLATPTTETVIAQPMNIQEGTNIVQITQASMDNLELEVKYKAGVSVTITEIQNAQLDDNVEVTING